MSAAHERQSDLAGANIEPALMEIALDLVAVERALGQRSRSVRARVVGDVERAADVVHRERETGRLDLSDLADGDVGRRAEPQA